MKRPILAAWILLLYYVPCFAVPFQAPDTQDMQKSCANFVQSFYDWYVKQPNWPRVRKYRPSAFSAELSRGLEEDYAAKAKSPDEIVGLDWDPILSGNDRPPGERYVVGRINLKGEATCWAELHQVWSGKETDEVVAAELVNNNGKWQFVNFYYRFPNSDLAASVSQGGLLTILKKQREARQRTAKAQAGVTPTPQPNNILPASKPAPATKPTPRN